jgi:lipoprotein-releasing system ATP-binding protein
MSTSVALGHISIRDLFKSFELGSSSVEVLKGISVEIPGGEGLAITGPSGSGKSTLLHLIGGLDSPTSGTIEIGEKTLTVLPEPELARFRNDTLGFIFQEHCLLPQYSVIENVLLPTLAFPADRRATRARAQELLRRVGLQERTMHRPGELSGGERQRVAVARALINKPKLLLCDEPTGSLDHSNATSIADLLLQMFIEENVTLIVVTHSLEFARRFNRRLELREGLCSEA